MGWASDGLAWSEEAVQSAGGHEVGHPGEVESYREEPTNLDLTLISYISMEL